LREITGDCDTWRNPDPNAGLKNGSARRSTLYPGNRKGPPAGAQAGWRPPDLLGQGPRIALGVAFHAI
jgi:hypothetical protein